MKFEHNNNFDLIRVLAALQVVLFHAVGILGLPIRPNFVAFILAQFPGVSVFFVVSGFLVTRSYLYGSGGLAAYLARRALRIYPALWVSTILIVILLAVTGSLATYMTYPKFAAWLAVSFVMGSEICGNFLVGRITQLGGFYPSFPSGVTWTLVVELGFYVLLPLILVGKFREKRFAWISLAAWTIVSLIVARYYFWLAIAKPEGTLTKLLSINPLTDLWEFLIGAACSIYWDKLRRLFEGRFVYWFLAYLAATILTKVYLGVAGLNSHVNTPLMPLMITLMAGVVISFAFTWRSAASVLRGNDFSYGIYLYHLPIVVTLKLLGMTGNAALWFVVLGGTFVLATFSWYCVEQPALQLKAQTDRWLVRLSHSLPPASA